MELHERLQPAAGKASFVEPDPFSDLKNRIHVELIEDLGKQIFSELMKLFERRVLTPLPFSTVLTTVNTVATNTTVTTIPVMMKLRARPCLKSRS